jgi:cell wall-associated NlpC family hydrolase
MRIASPSPRQRARAFGGALLLAVYGAAVAGPVDPADPVQSPLADRGWVAAAAASAPASAPAADAASAPGGAPGLLRQVRDRATDAVRSAMNFVGVRYHLGGTTAESGFDCSGFTRYVFENSLGLVLPRKAEEQAKAPGLIAVKREDLRPGDLVFFNTMKRTFSHVGIYIGDNRFIHAPSRGKDVRTDDLSFAYWAKRYTGARRAELGIAREPALPGDPADAVVR